MRNACAIVAVTLALTSVAVAEPVDLTAMPLASGGSATDDGGWRFDDEGYVGVYVRSDGQRPLMMTVRVDTEGDAPGLPALRVQYGASAGDVVGGELLATGKLPAGLHLITLAYPNDYDSDDRSLTIESLDIKGVEVLAEATDAVALEAANTYIEHFRRGKIEVALPEEFAGEEARVRLVRHDFNFGVNGPGGENLYLRPDAEPGSDAAKYQEFISERFNMTVPSNAGKWVYNETTRDEVDMTAPDQIAGFMGNARMHTMLWAAQQEPEWVYPLLDAAAGGDAAARDELREEISERIDYYLGERADRYQEVDLLNESMHQPRYIKAFGIDGVADIFREAREALDANGGEGTRLFLNEFNVLQWSHSLDADGEQVEYDPYANWYREHAESIRDAGGPVGGIGVQYYADSRTADELGDRAHSPLRIAGVLSNLGLTGLPVTLTEFEVRRGTSERAGEMIDETFRMFFGSPHVNSALIWAVNPAGDRPPTSILVDADWNLTPAGERFDAMMAEWTTDETVTVGDDGSLSFTGFWGEYEVTVGDETFHALARPGEAAALR